MVAVPRFTPPDGGLINPDIHEGLPRFLSSDAGLSSGYMIAHVAAAALLNECKVLAHPASVDSVPTSGGKEDHVSMGMTAALKLRQVVENLEQALAIEILCATQGLDYRKPPRSGEIAGREIGLDQNDDQRAERDLPKLAPDGLESLRSAML